MKIFTVAACLALIPVAANADAMADQRKTYEMRGAKIPHPPALCKLLTKSEAARYLGEPVRDGESAGPVSGCAYRSIADANTGVLVTRGGRSDWFPPTTSQHYVVVQGIGERAYTDYIDGLGYEATALNSAGVTSVQLSGKGNASTALRLLRIALNR